MKITVTERKFIDMVKSACTYPDSFSDVGIKKLFNRLEYIEKNLGMEQELCPQDIINRFAEYKSPHEAIKDLEIEEEMESCTEEEKILFLKEAHDAIFFNGGLIIDCEY